MLIEPKKSIQIRLKRFMQTKGIKNSKKKIRSPHFGYATIFSLNSIFDELGAYMSSTMRKCFINFSKISSNVRSSSFTFFVRFQTFQGNFVNLILYRCPCWVLFNIYIHIYNELYPKKTNNFITVGIGTYAAQIFCCLVYYMRWIL